MAATKNNPMHGLLGRPLTEKQQRLWDLKQAGKTRPQIAAELGISEPVVNKTIGVIRKKLGLKYDPKKDSSKAIENKDPERAAALIEAITNPLNEDMGDIRRSMEKAGFHERVREDVIRRLKIMHGQPLTDIKNLRRGDLSDLIGKKIHLGLACLDDKKMMDASARDIMLGVSALIEKKQLLDGQPTQIISDHERKKLNELTPLLIAEAQRRGITVDGQVTEKTVSPA